MHAVPALLPDAAGDFRFDVLAGSPGGLGAVVGSLGGWRSPSDVLHAGRVRVRPGAVAPAVLSALGRGIADALTARALRMQIWKRPDHASLGAELASRGMEVRQSKAYVRRSLADVLPAVPAEFRLASMADLGRPNFLARLVEAAEGDPFEEGEQRDPERELDELIAHAGDGFDPAHWLAIDDAKGPVGVVLPQGFGDGEGTCSYLGVSPARRGQGLGRHVHALGLSRLRDAGVERYVGSTDMRNVAMLRVFARNGCTITGTQQFVGPPG